MSDRPKRNSKRDQSKDPVDASVAGSSMNTVSVENGGSVSKKIDGPIAVPIAKLAASQRKDPVSKTIGGAIAVPIAKLSASQPIDPLPKRIDGPISKRVDGPIAVPIAKLSSSQRTGRVTKAFDGPITIPIAKISAPQRTSSASRQIPAGTQRREGHRFYSTSDDAASVVSCSIRRPISTSDSATPDIVEISAMQSEFRAMELNDGVEHRNNENFSSISSETAYCRSLLDTKKYYCINSGNAVAIVNWDPSARSLAEEYSVVSAMHFVNHDGNADDLLICTCSDSVQQCHRLLNIDNREAITPDFSHAERNNYCLHRKMVDRLGLQIVCGDEDKDGFIEQVENDPVLMWAVQDDILHSYGMIRRSSNGSLKCLVCNKARCIHLNYFGRELETFGLELPPKDFDPAAVVKVLSRKAITFDGNILRKFRFPVEAPLIPAVTDGLCEHGDSWSKLDPSSEGWIANSNCKIYNSDGRPYNGNAVFYR